MSENNKSENKSSLSEAEKFLESLNLPDSNVQETDVNSSTATTADPKDIMSFLDEISNYPPAIDPKEENKKKDMNQTNDTSANSWMSWGNSFWNQASAAVKSTTDQINKSVGGSEVATKLLEDRVKTLQSLVNKENIEKLGTGLKNLTTTILETVAPPISEHELVEVWLSHDMEGYSGLDALVYRAFARVMEHTESGQVVVRNPGGEVDTSTQTRNLNICDSLIDGTKLAKANVDNLIKQHYKPADQDKEVYTPESGAVPVIHCPVFMAIQPVKLSMSPMDAEDDENSQLSFILLMVDPGHNLKFKTCSQTVPLGWLNIPYEENEWVEDKMIEVIRMAVTTIAQDYVWTRMAGGPSSAHSDDAVQDV